MKRLWPASMLLALLLYTSAPEAGMIDVDIDPPNVVVGSPSVGDDTNPAEEVRWLEALLGYSYDDPAMFLLYKFIDEQAPSDSGDRSSWRLYDPSSVFTDKFIDKHDSSDLGDRPTLVEPSLPPLGSQ